MCDCAPTHVSTQEIYLSEHLVPVFDVECNSGLLIGTLLVLCCVELLLITVAIYYLKCKKLYLSLSIVLDKFTEFSNEPRRSIGHN